MGIEIKKGVRRVVKMKRILVALAVALLLLLVLSMPTYAAPREWLDSSQIGSSGQVSGLWTESFPYAIGVETAVAVHYYSYTSGPGIYNLPRNKFTYQAGETTLQQISTRIATELQDEFSIVCQLKWFDPNDPVRKKDWVGDGLHEVKWQDMSTGTIYYKYISAWFQVILGSIDDPLTVSISSSIYGPIQ